MTNKNNTLELKILPKVVLRAPHPNDSCGGPYPCSLLENRIHIIKCPNTNNPGILDNAKRVIERIRNKHKKKQQDFTKRKNLATTN